ncbi:MAG: TPM domain-containing protein [Alphaproteobacteria bacterium]|nr:TPM domain-containing protein [Alphaproteobacteria bacterium]
MKLIAFIISLFLFIQAHAYPQLTGQIVDEANIIHPEIENTIIQTLTKYNAQNIVITTINSLEGIPINEYAKNLGNLWGIGDKKLNNGIVMLIAPNERKVWIATGIGIEKTLTNSKVQQIINNKMLPYLKEDDYNRATIAGVNGLLSHRKDFAPSFWHKITHMNFELLIGILFLIAYSIGGFIFVYTAPREEKLKRFGLVLIGLVLIFLSLLKNILKGKANSRSGRGFGGGGRFGGGGAGGSF